MEFHREMLKSEHAGDTIAAARALGNVTLAREDAHAVWLLPWIESLWQDLAYGFRGLRRRPGFRPGEDQPLDPQAVAVLSYAAWQNKFGGDPSIVGTVVRLDDMPFTVVGVAPEGFSGTGDTADLWAPFSAHLILRPHDTDYK